LRRFPFIALALLAVVMVGCTSMGDGDSGASQKKQKAPEGTQPYAVADDLARKTVTPIHG
jgi:hypothetical protein